MQMQQWVFQGGSLILGLLGFLLILRANKRAIARRPSKVAHPCENPMRRSEASRRRLFIIHLEVIAVA